MAADVQSPVRKRGRPRSFCNEAALDAAAQVFKAKGYDGASLDDLTKAMNIGRPSLYAAFGDKRSLFLQVLRRYGERTGAMGIATLGAHDNIREALSAFLGGTLAGNTDCTARGCLVATSAGPAIGVVEGVAEAVSGLATETEGAMADRFEAAIEAGQLPPDFPKRERSRLAYDLAVAQARRARMGEDSETLAAEIPSKIDAILR